MVSSCRRFRPLDKTRANEFGTPKKTSDPGILPFDFVWQPAKIANVLWTLVQQNF